MSNEILCPKCKTPVGFHSQPGGYAIAVCSKCPDFNFQDLTNEERFQMVLTLAELVKKPEPPREKIDKVLSLYDYYDPTGGET